MPWPIDQGERFISALSLFVVAAWGTFHAPVRAANNTNIDKTSPEDFMAVFQFAEHCQRTAPPVSTERNLRSSLAPTLRLAKVTKRQFWNLTKRGVPNGLLRKETILGGNYVVAISDENNSTALVRMDMNGSNIKTLASGVINAAFPGNGGAGSLADAQGANISAEKKAQARAAAREMVENNCGSVNHG
jgi:hypothetical protein